MLVLLLGACEASRPNAGEFGTPTRVDPATTAPATRQIVRLTTDGLEYVMRRNELAAALTRQFGDGTVIDKVLVKAAPAATGTPAKYYLIGMGLNGGNFRAMALPLTGSTDSTYSLNPRANRYILTGRGCPMCFFNFEDGEIAGTTCAENTGNVVCDFKSESGNEMFTRR